MSDLNVNAYNGQARTVEQIATQSSQSTNNTVFENQETKKKPWEELQITQEEYTRLCAENPQFAQMTPEKQFEFIKALKNNPTNEAAQAAAPETQAVEETPQTESSSNVNNEADELVQAAKAHDKQSSDREFWGFDRGDFKNANLKEKNLIVAEEYTKNKFMFESEPPKSKEEWNALSDEERQKLMQASKKEVEAFIKEHKLAEYGTNLNNKQKEALIEKLYTDLQVSTKERISLKCFYVLKADEREDMVYDYINEVHDIETGAERKPTLTKYEESLYNDRKLLTDATKYYLEKRDNKEYNFCPSEISDTLKNAKVSAVEVKKAYYEHKLAEYEKMSDNDKKALSETEKKAYERMKRELPQIKKFAESPMGKAYLEKGKLAKPEQPTVLDKLNDSYSIKEALGDHEKAFVVNLEITKECNENKLSKQDYAQKMSECIQSALADGDTTLAYELYTIANKVAPKEMLKTQDMGTKVVAVTESDKLDGEGAQILAQEVEKIKDDEIRQAGAQTIQQQSTEEQKVPLAQVYIQSQDEVTRLGVVDNLRNNAEETENADEIDQIIRDYGDVTTRKRAIETTDMLEGADLQNKSLKRQLEDAIPDLVMAATKMPSKLDDQVGSGKIVFDSTLGLDKLDRIKAQNLLADDIVNFKAENQLEMHNVLLTSKDDEVLAHTSSNIHKYNESVQADAIRASYNTGNTKAIDAVNGQLEQCSKEAVSAVGSDVQKYCAETEARTTQAAAQTYAETAVSNNKVLENLTEPEELNTLSDADKKQYYIDLFLNGTDNKRYSILSKLPENQLKAVIAKLCQFNSSMVKGLVTQGLGKYVLQANGKSIDVLYSTVNIMFQKGGKDAKYAADYVLSNKSAMHFPDDMIQRASEILGEDNIKVQSIKNNATSNYHDILFEDNRQEISQYVSNPYGFVKNSLQPRLSDLYPNKKEMFYKA